jgi:hypothetical protein
VAVRSRKLITARRSDRTRQRRRAGVAAGHGQHRQEPRTRTLLHAEIAARREMSIEGGLLVRTVPVAKDAEHLQLASRRGWRMPLLGRESATCYRWDDPLEHKVPMNPILRPRLISWLPKGTH